MRRGVSRSAGSFLESSSGSREQSLRRGVDTGAQVQGVGEPVDSIVFLLRL